MAEMKWPDKIESIDDVQLVLAQIRKELADLEEMDLSDQGAVILYEPLIQLRAELQRLARDIQEVLAMTEVTDPVLDGMAAELRSALISAGADPNNPPEHSGPPADDAFAEYEKRGGNQHLTKAEFMDALIKRTGELNSP